jgi:putative membrane protein
VSEPAVSEPPATSPFADDDMRPDYRFSLANERTFLAWVRTALALLAAGIGVVDLPSHFSSKAGRQTLGIVLIVLGLLAAGGSYWRWRANDAAIRGGADLPTSRSMPIIALGLTGVALLALVLVLVDL